VRINKELKQELKKLAENMRPRTAIQYLIKDAIEHSLNQIAEDGGRALFEFVRHFLGHVDADGLSAFSDWVGCHRNLLLRLETV